MTANISEIVDVQISLETQAISQEGFGVPLVLGDNATFGDRIRYYTTLAAVEDDFLITDEEYLAAQAIFSQEVNVERMAIGKMASRVAMVQLLDFDADFVTGNVINLDVDGVAIGPINFTTDHATTAGLLEAALEATASIGAVTVAGNNLTINAAAAGIPFEITNVVVTGGASQPVGTLTTTTPNHGVAEDLSEIEEIDNGWYGVLITSTTAGDILQAAAWTEARRKIFAARTNAAAAITTATTDIASLLEALNYDRTFISYNADTNDFIDAASFGENFPFTPGSRTWKFKTYAGVVADNLTDTETANAKGKNLNTYRTIAGRDIFSEGVMASGEFIDVIHGIDLLQYDIETEIFTVLANSPKVPYTDAGIATIENVLRGVLERKKRENFISSYTVTVPKVADISQPNRAARFLPDIKFNAVLAGAIHKTQINGVVTV